ncbi:growth-arrest specific micro-tubule binding domain-containing protein [Ophiocordyceps camponoti-floridani]|uniref:Growth-arrest specific micro-tubule binding domain-containing protein n=1 Tax=Ophiocordyceps camponoti-floridani TaxID=2030778 RepID=A0A8H4VGJ1_9HYPO|nr:growth-arrest specific micro-tubule binding domain-containing protein [Ophiocordyceps camponoti-floridani]
MPSSHPPANTTRKARPQPTAEDTQEKLLDDLKNANTKLNKLSSDRDRYKHNYETLLSQTAQLTSQLHSADQDAARLRTELARLQRENDRLRRDVQAWSRSHAELQREQRRRDEPAAPSVVAVVDRHGSRERRAEKERLQRRFEPVVATAWGREQGNYRAFPVSR